jgi:alkylation response protein AidB-like acyl-CoA dehydrogenase
MSVVGTATRGTLVLGDLADELRGPVHDFVAATSPEAEVRRLMETDEGFDPDVWRQLAEQLDVLGMTIPEKYGGSGLSLDAQAVVFEELGATLMCVPYLSNAVAIEAIVASRDDEAAGEYLPKLGTGQMRATIAVLESDGRWETSSIKTSAGSGRDAELSGSKAFVLDGHTADLLLVAARSPEGVDLYAVDPHAAGISRRAQPAFDPTRKQATITLAATRGRRLGEAGAGQGILELVLQYAAAAVAAEQVGGASACLEMSAQYAKDRVQFGRPIGAFQAVKHKCAEMLRLTEFARAAAYEAAIARAADRDDTGLTASVAKAYCSEAFAWVAAETIQVHGGIGYTWEHPAHLYFRRAKSTEQLFGTPREHRDRVLQHLGYA